MQEDHREIAIQTAQQHILFILKNLRLYSYCLFRSFEIVQHYYKTRCSEKSRGLRQSTSFLQKKPAASTIVSIG